jgi:mxaJ protein
MSSASRNLALLGLALAAAGTPGPLPVRTLRVCADPNNLPFSNRREQGFENRIARLIAADLHATVTYTWWAQRRGFVRNTLKQHSCDVIMGVPVGMSMVLATAPYYRSTYVFVTRRGQHPGLRSLDDPRLRRLKIGVSLIGDDGANPPPALGLAQRGIVRNVTGYPVYGDYATESPPSRIIDAVARGEIDVAVAWGPMAGYWTRRAAVPLTIAPIEPAVDRPFLPNVFAIAVGVRKRDSALRATLDAALARRRADIAKILDSYGVPRTGAPLPAERP